MFGDIAGLGEAVKAITKLTKIADTLLNDSGIIQKFEDTGKITGAFSLEGYRVNFAVEKEIKEISEADDETDNQA
ncbi:MAG: hypothetical protein PHV39_04275 [Methanomicrobium sp.]|nr:hypothetical protein [Methanomicrobium sp.]